MRQLCLSLIAATLTAAGVLTVAGAVNAAPGTSIVGTWSGQLTASPGSGASPRRFTVVVYRGERGGRWRIGSRCAGTLRLKDISGGYHHYYRLAGAGCAPRGIDCLQRVGAQMVDVFVSNSGTANTTVKFRRVG